jgi:hypothetical protein
MLYKVNLGGLCLESGISAEAVSSVNNLKTLDLDVQPPSSNRMYIRMKLTVRGPPCHAPYLVMRSWTALGRLRIFWFLQAFIQNRRESREGKRNYLSTVYMEETACVRQVTPFRT